MKYTVNIYLNLNTITGQATLKDRKFNGKKYIPKAVYKLKRDADKVAKAGRDLDNKVRIVRYQGYFIIYKRV